MGSSPYRRISLLVIAHPIVGPPFRYRECAGRRRSLEADIEKKAGCGFDSYFCKTCIRMLNFDIFFVKELCNLNSYGL